MRFRCRLAWSTALMTASAVAHPSPADAQISATLDAGGMHAAYDDAGDAAAVTVSPAFRIDRASLSVDAAGTLSRFADSWSAQASLATSYFMPAFGPLQGEIDAGMNGSAQPGTSGTGLASGGMRLHLLHESRGLWLGAQVARASDGSTWRSTIAGDLGGWVRFGDATAVLQVAPSAIGSDLRYTDASMIARAERGRGELVASIGLRDWYDPVDAVTRSWASLAGTLWLGDHLALALSGGSYPTDWAQGFTGGKYVSVGIRVATHRPTSRQAIANSIQRTLPPVPQPVAEAFQAERAPNGEWTLDVTAPSADNVEVMADFTDWRPVPLERRADGRWSVTLPIAPGTHRLNLRVGTGTWGIPPGLPVLTDEFSGVVALLTTE